MGSLGSEMMFRAALQGGMSLGCRSSKRQKCPQVTSLSDDACEGGYLLLLVCRRIAGSTSQLHLLLPTSLLQDFFVLAVKRVWSVFSKGWMAAGWMALCLMAGCEVAVKLMACKGRCACDGMFGRASCARSAVTMGIRT